ncbi:MAG: CPBP family intramembrane metalloprotease [Thermoguttaceae bacterium]|nr:CPBP family intramembrane metalloprotease [Thermoguttaceae bacterium]
MNIFFLAADAATNVDQIDSLWFQIPLAALCVYLFSSLAAWRFGFAVFKTRDDVRRAVVPWGLDVAFAMLIVFSIISPAVCSTAIKKTCADFLPTFGEENAAVATQEEEPAPAPTDPTGDAEEERDLSTQHPVARMFIRAKNTPYFGLVFGVFVLSVVVVAPLTEELVFRVVLQGACERLAFGRERDDEESEARRSQANLGKVLLTIVPPAIVFAILHAGSPEDPENPTLVSELFRQTLSSVFANVVTATFLVAFLVKIVRARPSDFGLGEEASNREPRASRLVKEFYRGAVLYLYSMPIVYFVKTAFQLALPGYVVDPAPILVFALWEGFVYYKTHSYPTVVGMHVGLNFTSFLFLCMQVA